MYDQTNILKIKLDRRRILEYLNMMYPVPLQTRTLFQSIIYVNPAYDLSTFRKDVFYLRDKGWVEFVDEKIGGMHDFEQKVLALTAAGKEVAEGTGTDQAMEI